MRCVLVLAAAAVVSLGAHAQAQPSEQDHAAHHPEAASAPASAPALPAPVKPKDAVPRAKAAPTANAPASSAGSMAMGRDMTSMHDAMHAPGGMHEQMHGKEGAAAMPGAPMKGTPATPAASR